ncbi:MAG: HIT family protein [Nitrososphaerales archaeon]
MMREDCVFCKIIKGEIPSYKLFEDGKTFAMLDRHPLTNGHTLVIPKTHTARVEELDSEDAKSLFATVQRIIGPILRSVDAEASTIGINDGPEAGQVVPHVHIHIVPRSGGDGGGTIHSIIGRRLSIDDRSVSDVAERIQSEISKTSQDAT